MSGTFVSSPYGPSGRTKLIFTHRVSFPALNEPASSPVPWQVFHDLSYFIYERKIQGKAWVNVWWARIRTFGKTPLGSMSVTHPFFFYDDGWPTWKWFNRLSVTFRSQMEAGTSPFNGSIGHKVNLSFFSRSCSIVTFHIFSESDVNEASTVKIHVWTESNLVSLDCSTTRNGIAYSQHVG